LQTEEEITMCSTVELRQGAPWISAIWKMCRTCGKTIL